MPTDEPTPNTKIILFPLRTIIFSFFISSTSNDTSLIIPPDSVLNRLIVICLIPVSKLVVDATSSVASVPAIITGGMVSVPSPCPNASLFNRGIAVRETNTLSMIIL